MFQDVNLWKLMGDFNLHGITAPGRTIIHCIKGSFGNQETWKWVIFFKNILIFSALFFVIFCLMNMIVLLNN